MPFSQTHLRALATATLLLAACALHADERPGELPRGVVIARVVTHANPHQSYALYVPATYNADRRWPVLIAFDPRARGRVPVDLFKNVAESYGYIVAGSNNSENGPVDPDIAAADNMLQDIRARFAIDERRIYLTGFSGGGRLAALIALRCSCVAGVFSHGAGFPPEFPPSAKGPRFLYFATAGDRDMNYREVMDLSLALDAAGYASRIRQFNGTHQWAPEELCREAIEWFELQAMKAGSKPADNPFLDRQFARSLEAAQKLERSHDNVGAHYAYSRIVQDFDGLHDVSEAKQKVAEFAARKIRKMP